MTDAGVRSARVAGTFVVMIGAGVVLETAALWFGIVVLLAGVGLVFWGSAAAGIGDTVAAPVAPTVVPAEGRESKL